MFVKIMEGKLMMKKQSILSKLMGYAGYYRYLTYLSWILSVISSLIALVPFVYIWEIIKEVLDVDGEFSKLSNVTENGWLAVAFAVLSMLIYILGLLCSHLSAFRVQANIRSDLMHRIIKLPMGFMDSIGSGKLRKTVDESSAATESYLAHQLPDQSGAYATPIGLLAMLIIFDWRLGLLSLVPVIIGFAIMSSMTGAKMKKKMEEYQNSLDNMSNEAVEYVRGIPVVKTFGQTVFSFKRFKASIDNYQKWVISYTKDLRLPMMFYTAAINSVFAVLIVAALFFTANGVTNEFMLSLLFYIIITPVITVSLNKIMYSSENKMVVSDALERIEKIKNLIPLNEPITPIKPVDNSIELKNISFRYSGATENALDDISLKINSGEHIAFVGESGGGKTTLASIIARFFDVDSGEVVIGGANVKNICKNDLMNTVSFVFQDSKLLKASIFENVRMAKPSADRTEVIKALHEAQCDDIISKLPNGIDTVIGSMGVYLSGGEQQRISIARVMLKNSPILILDEATAFADPDNEVRVQAAFSKLSKGKTVIMIAHRLSTVKDCDRIFVLENGNVAEVGTHSQLVNKNKIYAHMWNEYEKAADWKVGM